MSDWLIFAGMFAAFFATHSIPVRPAVKERLVARLGQRGFTATYSALSIVMLALLTCTTQQAPFVLVWAEAPWHRPVIWMGMLIACVILSVSTGRPNPFSFGGRHNGAFEPESAGIIGFIRHPLLTVLALWAGLHLLVNGDLAHIIFFGVLSAFAILGQRIVDRRKKRELGGDRWEELLEKTRNHRHFSLPSGATALRILIGLSIYLLLVILHPYVIGQSVFL